MEARRIGTISLAVLAGMGVGDAATTVQQGGTAPSADAPPKAQSAIAALDAATRLPALGPRSAPEKPFGAPPVVTITVRGSLLRMTARDAPLREVLAAVARASGIAFTGVEGATERISATLGPLPVKDLVVQLLDRTSCGYAYLGPMRAGEPARVVLVPAGRPATETTITRTAMRPIAPLSTVETPDPEAMRQQRATDAMFDACKERACDSS